MDRRHLLTLALGAAAAGACGGPTSTTPANRPIVVKVGDAVQANNPMVAAERYFAEQVSALTGGRYQVEVAAGGILGDDSRVNEMVRTGQVAFAKTLVSNLSAYDKRLGVLALPYVFTGEKDCMAALDGELGRRCATILYESGLALLAWFYGGERNVYNARRPIHTPADLKGLRIRVPQNIVSIDMINAMGARAVPMATNDILSALQQQVVEGAENNTAFYVTEQHVVYAPYYSRTRHQHSINVLLASRKWLAEQPADVQDAIRAAGRRTQTEQLRLWAAQAQRPSILAESHGAMVNDVDVPAFRRAITPVLREHRGTLGDLPTLLPDA